MKKLYCIMIVAAALFCGCNSKPGARARVNTTSGTDSSSVSSVSTSGIDDPTYGGFGGGATPAPGEVEYDQAMRAFEAGDTKSAFGYCEESANKGFAPAQFNMAIFYYNGDGVTKDLSKTVYWLEKAAKQGHLQAQKQLALCYRQGLGTKKDDKKGTYWYEEAAKLGDAEAQYKTATAYFQGIGVIPAYEPAVKWYKKAADQGLAEAQNDLALCYENGLGVEKIDPNKALELYQKAAAQGNKTARANAERLKKDMDKHGIIYEIDK